MSCSDEFYNIMKLDPIVFGKSYEAMMDIIHPEDRPSVQKSINHAIKELKPFSNDYRIIRPDGSIRTLSSKGEVITDSSGKPLRIVGTEQDITEQKLADEKIKSSLKEKEMLLQEIHHRVKNNLQVISSLLRLQSRYINDQKSIDIFKETQNRVRSIAILHEKLYQSEDLAKIRFDEYVKVLTEDLLYFYELDKSNIKMNIDVEEISLNIETAIPCGLIIDEMVANSLKYAFPDERNGEIKIELHSDDNNKYSMCISDNGVGISEDIDPEKTDTFGMQLIKYLTKQLKANIELDKSNGTTYNLTFNELEYKDRVK
jgi:two-component sensor histidine kinase